MSVGDPERCGVVAAAERSPFVRTIRTLLTAAPGPHRPFGTLSVATPHQQLLRPGREAPSAEAKEQALGQTGSVTRY